MQKSDCGRRCRGFTVSTKLREESTSRSCLATLADKTSRLEMSLADSLFEYQSQKPESGPTRSPGPPGLRVFLLCSPLSLPLSLSPFPPLPFLETTRLDHTCHFAYSAAKKSHRLGFFQKFWYRVPVPIPIHWVPSPELWVPWVPKSEYEVPSSGTQWTCSISSLLSTEHSLPIH
jgi:hypothetical protein